MTQNQKRYFSHDSDAFLDSRIIKMRAKLGLAGYGAYWMIIERLRTADQYQLETDYEVLAFISNDEPELFRSVVEDFDLFEFSEDDGQTYFYSASLRRRMMKMEDIIEKRREAGRKGAEARWQTDGNTDPLSEQEDDISMANAIPIAKQMPYDCHSTALAKNGKLNKTKLNQTKLNKTKANNTKELSTEPSRDASMQEPVFIKLPLNDGTEHLVTEKDLQRYAELYPAVDIKQDLRNMAGWLEANPTKRKTKNGVRRFITNWLARTQNAGGSKGNGQSGGRQGPYVSERDRIKEAHEYDHPTDIKYSPVFQAFYEKELAKKAQEEQNHD